MMVNQTMARAFWPGESAVGKRIRPGTKDWLTVVGVVGDIKNAGLNKPAGTEIFLPALQLQNVSDEAYVIVKAAGDPRRLTKALERAVHQTDPAGPVSKVRLMEDVIAGSQSRPRFLALVLTLFSTISLALAAFGVYGVISYSVSQRTPEFGIRMALGAQRAQVLGLVLRDGMLLGALGLLAGGAGAAALSRGLEEMLFQVSRFDVATFVSMALVLGAVTLLACWIPARRATAVDPIQALRYE